MPGVLGMPRCLFSKPRRPVVSAVTHYFNPTSLKKLQWGNLIETELVFCSCEDIVVIIVTLRSPVKDDLLLFLKSTATVSNGQQKGDRLICLSPFLCPYNSTGLWQTKYTNNSEIVFIWIVYLRLWIGLCTVISIKYSFPTIQLFQKFIHINL